MNKVLLTIVLVFFAVLMAEAQVISESQVKKELTDRGIDEARFKEELLKKGIDINKIDQNNPQEIMRYEKDVREIIVMLEKENQAKKATEAPKQQIDNDKEPEKDKNLEENKATTKDTKAIIDKVKDGASIDEAVIENLQDKQTKSLPSPNTYGQQIFRDNSLALYRTSEGAKPPKSYILGPGDVVTISIFGNSELNFTQEISKEGFIKMDREPRYYLSGLTVEEAEKMLLKNLRSHYSFDAGSFAFSVNTARTINVNIFGEVFNNGTFNISALNSAFNALVAAGGPSNNGSVRKIKLLRAKEEKKIDVYKYLLNPAVSLDLYLQENDYIIVPVADKVVKIEGAVTRPFKYELIEEEGLRDLIQYAGGLKANALKRNITISRFENDVEKKYSVNYLDLIENNKKFLLQNGDYIIVDTIQENEKNIVEIEGAVANPGIYAFEKGMKLSALLKLGKVNENAITDKVIIRRYNEDQVTVKYETINIDDVLKNTSSKFNIELQKGDMLTIRSKADFVEKLEATISGAVRIPGSIQISKKSGLNISDAIFIAGGLRDDATDFAFIFRRKQNKTVTQEYIKVDLKKALENRNSQEDISLEPRDSIVVFSKIDFEDNIIVTIDGAVRKPGDFTYSSNLTIKDLVLLAGGFTLDAATNRIDVYRINIDNEKKTKTLAAQLSLDPNLEGQAAEYKVMPYDQIYIRRAPEFELQSNVVLIGEIVYPGQYSMLKDNTRLSDVIAQAGGLSLESAPENATLYRTKNNTGFVVINLKEALKSKGSFSDIILQDGDEIEIPKRSAIVSIQGATNYQGLKSDLRISNGKINIAFEGNKSAKYYVDKYAAGFDKNADVKKMWVQHSNGKVEGVKHFLFWRTYPSVKEGSVINVPYKQEDVNNLNKEEKSIDWGDVLKDSITQATAILSLILLIQSVN